MKIIIGFILGYIITSIISGKKEGDKLSRSIRFSIGNYYLHLHHWVLGVFFILILGPLVIKINSNFLFGFAVGVIVQGIKYKDHLFVWYKKSDENKIHGKKNNKGNI